ncbi:aldehyde ferredoxin oxidoreductase family protein [Desulfofundulus sp. TPOSR]|uniref:aldehyde ferredoxin oxidoreductase family protein n=1 Tax=Desulfofundulus sp. TPOSR TaxID=2714340 RepID=UPI00140CAE9F|nr:aldehyde ferredoxin oxidoreductase family protein [Desulfofundulus sp. TPOSR]NHM28579.1 aldehyde ferredoxin oxidoreductase family protein [Desulfofundulus sp. TPOSR]
MRGFYGRLLRIDLSTRQWQAEEIPDEVLAAYLGGKGLGTYLMLQNIPPGADPLGPENCLIFTTGPVTGTAMPGSNRFGVFARSPLTGFYGESYSGGHVGAAMKRTGYDAIIIQGQAKNPTLLEVTDQNVYFRDGTKLWGLDCYAAEDGALADVGARGAQAVVIGPAGENLVRYACIENNYWRSAGRTGMGAVMGSKKLKAIVFHGRAGCELADPAGLKQYVAGLAQKARDNAGVLGYRKYGTPQLVSIMNSVGAFPARYWSRGTLPGWESLTGDYLIENFEVQPRACRPCLMTCGNLTRVTRGRHEGLMVEGPEYETIYSFGGLCCIHDLSEIIYLNDICDRLGLDTISAGNMAAFAIEAAQRGALDVKVAYGDVEGIAQLLHQIARREGVGDLLAEGIRVAAEKLGLSDLAIHVKGMEPAGYDPRVLQGMGLAYATSPRGACHLRATFYKPELAGIIDPKTTHGKAELFIDYEDRLAIYDALILCRFYRDLVLWEDLATLVNATTGLGVDEGQLRRIAGRIVAATRQFNLLQGLTRDDDNLPPRFFKEPLENGDVLPEENFRQMLADYYRLRGWDEEGRPIVGAI